MRILFVAMPDSVHAARWISHIAGQGWDIRLFSATSAGPHPSFKDITIYGLSFVRPEGLDRSTRLRGIWPTRIGAERLGGLMGAKWLSRVIRWFKPDIIQSMEIQHAGYLTLEAKKNFKGKFPKWIVGNWGSDIYLFGRLPEHAEKIRAVLEACDYYNCECHRDVELARAFGFKGEVLPVLPIAGGYNIEEMAQFRQPGPTSSRRLIALKGYQNWAGRALFGLRAIELCADALNGYRLALYLSSPEVRLAAQLLSQKVGIPIEIIDGTREDILRMHGRARVSIGLSISDAISTSLLETMIMGSFPVQSNTGCGDEWLQNGETGLLVPPEDSDAVAAAIRRAVTDDQLVNSASELNDQLARERLARSDIQTQAIAIYNRIAAQARGDLKKVPGS